MMVCDFYSPPCGGGAVEKPFSPYSAFTSRLMPSYENLYPFVRVCAVRPCHAADVPAVERCACSVGIMEVLHDRVVKYILNHFTC